MSKKSSRKSSKHSESEEESAGEMTWPRPDFDKQKIASSVKHPQLFRKKRVYSASFSHSGTNGLTVDGVPSDVRALTAALHKTHVTSTRGLYGKNSKKSRDGRRIPNKRGGKSLEDPTDVLDEIVLDHEDPDYDSDVEDPVILETLKPSPTDEDFEQRFASLMNEFFVHGKTQEVVDVLSESNLAPHQRRRLPYLAITMALQHKQTQCELTSELLSDLCGKVLNQAHIQQGFGLLLNELGELLIDFPKAPEHVGRFIARAMADDILPPKFIEFQKTVLSQPPAVHCHGDSKNGSSPPVSAPPTTNHPVPGFDGSEPGTPDIPTRTGARNLSDSSNGVEQTTGTSVSSGIGSASSLTITGVVRPEIAMGALVRAENLLTLSHAFARLDNIWGVPVGPKATKLLVRKIRGLLQAYFNSKDFDEANETLLELDSPHFHHELVFQAVVMAIERSTDDARALVVRLLKELCHSVVITPNQLALGIRRVYAELTDLQLDVPAAYLLMERFLRSAQEGGFVSRKLASEMPTKQRKRFISETDSIYRTGHTIGL